MGLEREFKAIWTIDFEFLDRENGEAPHIHCLAAKELKTGRVIQLWRDELVSLSNPPFDIGQDSVVVTYVGEAEMRCFLALGWPLPVNLIDLFAEFVCFVNGVNFRKDNRKRHYGLLVACRYFGIDIVDDAYKVSMKQLAIRGTQFSNDERKQLLAYCLGDVVSTEKLIPYLVTEESKLEQLLFRGRYVEAATIMAERGLPIDVDFYEQILAYREPILDRLTQTIDADFGWYNKGKLVVSRFEDWVRSKRVDWPLTPGGRFKRDRDTLKAMLGIFPELEPMRQLMKTRSQLKGDAVLPIGSDGRNRARYWPFSATNSRCAPNASDYILLRSKWQRSLVCGDQQEALIYADFAAQEVGIASCLSGDPAMQRDYVSSDFYLDWGKGINVIPFDATKRSHKRQRSMLKACMLGLNYGSSAFGLAPRLGLTEFEAQDLIDRTKNRYKKFFDWRRATVDFARLYGYLVSPYGWRLNVEKGTKTTLLFNFLMPASAGDILREFTIMAIERGVNLVATLHDSCLVFSPIKEAEEVARFVESLMVEASGKVLGGFELKVDYEIFKNPARYVDPDGAEMWNLVSGYLDEIRRREGTQVG